MEKVISHFKKLVNINSPSKKEKPMADYLVDRLKELNFQVTVDKGGKNMGDTGNVIGKRDGKGQPLLLCAHMDTVESTENIVIKDEEGRISTDGTTILGADDKAGLVAILEGIKMAGENTRPVEIVFTFGEEAGLNGSKALDISQFKSKNAFVLDSGGDVGTVIVKAPSEIDFAVKIHGKAAHSGVNPEDGVSAIKIAGIAIGSLPMGRIDEETTANIGVLNGGTSTNVVCPLVELKGEVRSHNFSKAEKIHDQYKDVFEVAAKEMGGKIEWISEVVFKNFEVKKDEDIILYLKKKFDALKLDMVLKPRGGGSDANILNNKGIKTVNLGVGMEKGHSKEEYITHQNLINATKLVKTLVEVED